MKNFVREAVGIFDNPSKLDAAIAELEVTAFPRQDISVLGSQRELEKQYGSEAIRPEWLEDNPNAPRNISVRPEEKTIGATVIVGLCAYICGCAAAVMMQNESMLSLLTAIMGGSIAGGIFGAMIVYIIRVKFQTETDKQIREGGLLLWVRTNDLQKEQLAQDILLKHGARHVHVHSIT